MRTDSDCESGSLRHTGSILAHRELPIVLELKVDPSAIGRKNNRLARIGIKRGSSRLDIRVVRRIGIENVLCNLDSGSFEIFVWDHAQPELIEINAEQRVIA